MGILNRLFGSQAPIEAMRANLLMEYHIATRTGSAAVEWVPLASDDSNLRPLLVALLYARILFAHTETRTRLFELVDVVSKQNVRDEGHSGFRFPEWDLPIGLGFPEQRIWPWTLVDNSGALSEPKVYSATLLAFPESRQFGINLKMAVGQERLLAPASALIAITSHAQSTDQEGRYELAGLLWQMNEYYGSPDRVHLGSEAEALAAASAAIRSGRLRLP
jgi:hypothetical protein